MGERPLWTALERIRREDLARFYMPGHKGRMPEPFAQAALYDVTEITGADNLYQCTGAIRALEDKALAGIPIIAMTANAFEEDRQAALRCGMNGHIAKPIDISALIETLDQILE